MRNILTFACVVFLLGASTQAEAGFWFNPWQYRRPVVIDNQANPDTLTNYQVLVTLNTDMLISEGKLLSDGADIRFCDSDRVTELSYWVESGMASTSTEIWVKVPNIPSGSKKTVYLYYANSNALGTASFDNTMSKEYGESGLVGLYHMDEGSGTTIADSSGNAYTGTLYNSVGWSASDGGHWDGRTNLKFSTGSALDFDGTNDGVRTNVKILGTSSTMEFWLYPRVYYVTNDPAHTPYIICENNDAHYTMRFGAGLLQCFIKDTNALQKKVEVSQTSVPLDEWTHLALVHDTNSGMNLYLNGESKTNLLEAFSPKSMANGFVIGCYNIGPSFPMLGMLDEVRIYNKALSQDEIKSHYERRAYTSPVPSVEIGEEEKPIRGTAMVIR